MNWSIVQSDLKRNKGLNFTLFLFMMLSSGLAVLSVVMAVQTFTSINNLYRVAQPPHFAQMHKGAIDQQQLQRFLSDQAAVTYSQIDTMIDVYGESLTVTGKSAAYNLSDCRLDIGLVKQNTSRDLLLNADHEAVVLEKGEIGIPVLLREMYGMELGDHVILTINEVRQEYIISTFILDAMMNSPMASSTRILLSDLDYESLLGKAGEKEYLIEAYFHSPEEAKTFMTAYQDAGLPQNGQAVTYSILFFLSALTDMVTMLVLLLVSALLITVAFICVKYTIMASLEEEIGEIGTMKAIGLPYRDIRSLYLDKYRLLAMTGAVAGLLLALMLSRGFTAHISKMFGSGRLSLTTLALAFLADGMVYLIINYYCRRVLSKIKRFTIVDALVTGKSLKKERRSNRDGLYHSSWLSVNSLLGIREVILQFRSYRLVAAVVFLTVLMTMLPVNLLNTLKAPEFITYMGSSLEDILIEVKNGEELEAGYMRVRTTLDQDTSIKHVYEARTIRIKTANAENTRINLDIDCGSNAGEGLQYLSGKPPVENNEIALSLLNAKLMDKQTGDKIVLHSENSERSFIVSGVYQDVTSGGYTAKAKYDFSELPAKRYSFLVDLKQNTIVEEKAAEWADIIGAGVSVIPMAEFINQTLGGVASQLQGMVFTVFIIGTGLVILITVLFLKLRLAVDLSDIGILKAIGFSNADIRRQYMIKTGGVSILGLFTGILVTNILGEKIINLILSTTDIGIKKVHLMNDPVLQFILCPFLILLLVLLVTRIVAGAVRKNNIISVIHE